MYRRTGVGSTPDLDRRRARPPPWGPAYGVAVRRAVALGAGDGLGAVWPDDSGAGIGVAAPTGSSAGAEGTLTSTYAGITSCPAAHPRTASSARALAPP